MAEPEVTPIAVLGMACRLPGGIDSPEKLWQALEAGADLVTEVPADRWDADEFYDPERGVPGRTVSRWGAFLDDIGGFDAPFFGLDDEKATAIDPQHRLLMETAWEAIEQAGIDPSSLAGTRTGVYLGISHDDHTSLTLDAGVYGYTETAACMASGRVAYVLNVHGPALTFDTACSSGLLAVHMAARSLHAGESDLALAGGCMVMREPRKNSWASAQGMLSPTGRCKPFDEAADGFVRSEGCVVVLLKRLPDAVRDGDRILAVVRGTAANSDGRTRNIATPSVDAQVDACRAALAAAGVDPDTIGAVEAHGTGTPVGDPIEFTSLATTYGKTGTVLLGSAKSNFGHTESAAGALGFVKAVLQLQHGVVPAMVHFHRMPESLTKIETGLSVPQEVTPWPTGHGGPRRIAVSSYGISGTNVHAIVEQAPSGEPRATEPIASSSDTHLFTLSASSSDELRNTADRLSEWIEHQTVPVSLADLGYTLARRRGHRNVRATVAATDLPQLCTGLRAIASGDSPLPAKVGQDDRGPVWVFSGQGSQWAQMGSELLSSDPVFAATVARIDPLVRQESGFSVTEAMTAPDTVTEMEKIQPTLFAVQVALAEAMAAKGVRPGAVIGHSMGEAAAAVVAGSLTLEDGVRVICRRSRLLSRLSGAGAMASVELPEHTVRQELADRGVDNVVVAVVASPTTTVVGGDAATIRGLVVQWEERDVMAREVAVDVASHSPQVDPILPALADELAELVPAEASVPFYSSTRPDPRERPAFDARYWVDNLRQMVRFSAAVQAALEDGYRVFAELSPHPLLTRAVEQTAQSIDTPVAALAAMRRDQSLPNGLLGFVSDLHAAGAAVDFAALYPTGNLIDVPLPCWTHHHLLLDRRAGSGADHLVAAHPLLGAHVRLIEEPVRHAWQSDVGTVAAPWLADHRVHDVAALPGAAYCEMALAAAEQLFPADSEVRDVRFEDLLLLDDHTELSAVAALETPGAASFTVQTDEDADRVLRATATLHAAEPGSDDTGRPAVRDLTALLAAHPNTLSGKDIRDSLAARGIDFGPAFTGLLSVHTAPESATLLGEVSAPAGIRAHQSAYGIHPAVLDACFQTVGAHFLVEGGQDRALMLPLSAKRLRSFGTGRGARYCHATVTKADAIEIEADLEILDERGEVVLCVDGLRMGSGTTKAAERERVLSERLLTVGWEQRKPPTAATAGAGEWIVIAGDGTDLEDLPEALSAAGAHCRTIRIGPDGTVPADELTVDPAKGVVLVTAAHAGDPDDGCLTRGRELVGQVVRIARVLADTDSRPPRLYVITRNAQDVTPQDRLNLDQGGVRGLLRVIGSEQPSLRPTQIDIDARTSAEDLAGELLSDSDEDETAWREGQWFVARLQQNPLRADERRTALADPDRDGVRLQVRVPGDLQTLEMVAAERRSPDTGQIEVSVRASSINFADVLVAFGRYPSFDGRRPELGLDFAGVVSAVGPGVTEHSVGDRVAGVSPGGCWGSFVTCDARLAAPLPAALSDEEAAAAATGYATAWFGLHDLARLGPGDRVLIHSATGGVGLAAIAIARHAGAEIFATAGSPARRKLLQDMGIEHVYDSRSTEFADAIRADTDGYGVDVVLNSLIGPAQRAGVELLAFGGRFVEIGKRDVYEHTRLDLYPFRRNLAFYYADLALMTVTDPQRSGVLLRKVYELVGDGVLPVPEHTAYPMAQASSAIRAISAAEHIGKLVLTVPHGEQLPVRVPPGRAPAFRPDGSYIITGGVGGLGLFLAAAMASAGCGRIVLTSRSAPNAQAEKTIARLRATGADIVVECGNIAEPETAARLVAAATESGHPLRGVLHAAAVVDDATLENITDELIQRDWAPKVLGAWHLHHAALGQPLDWFCNFSSAAVQLGSPGQGAYAAANSWLDEFTAWQRRQGVPAMAIAWGAWADIGAGAKVEQRGTVTMIRPEDGAYAFRALLRHDRGYTAYLPIRGMPLLAALAARSPFAEAFGDASDQTAGDNPSLLSELAGMPPEERPHRLRRLVTDQAGLILRRAIDPDRPFAEHGLDSLGMLELRTSIETQIGIRVSPKTIVTYNTARALATHLSDALAADRPPPR